MTDVVLCECFARDGLQHEAEFVPTEVKRTLIERFAALGFRRLETVRVSGDDNTVRVHRGWTQVSDTGDRNTIRVRRRA